MNNGAFGKTMENVKTRRNVKLVTPKSRKNYLVLEPNYHTAKFFTENLLGTRFAISRNDNNPNLNE